MDDAEDLGKLKLVMANCSRVGSHRQRLMHTVRTNNLLAYNVSNTTVNYRLTDSDNCRARRDHMGVIKSSPLAVQEIYS